MFYKEIERRLNYKLYLEGDSWCYLRDMILGFESTVFSCLSITDHPALNIHNPSFCSLLSSMISILPHDSIIVKTTL